MMVQPCHNHGPVNKIERHYFAKSASCFLLCFQQLLLSFYVFSGATSAPCLIFIFPAIFYIRIVPKDKEPMSSTPKILVRPPHSPPFLSWLGCCCWTLSACVAAHPPRLPASLHWEYPSWWWVWASSSSTGRWATVSPPEAIRRCRCVSVCSRKRRLCKWGGRMASCHCQRERCPAQFKWPFTRISPF